MIRSMLAALAVLTLPAAPVWADAADDFAELVADFEAHEASGDPVGQGRDGDRAAARRWADLSTATVEARNDAELEFLDRLEAIDAEALPENDQVSYAVLDYVLRYRVELAPFQLERIPFTNDSGFYSGPSYTAASTRLRSRADAEDWIARLEAVPLFLNQNQAWMQQGLATGFVQPRNILPGVLDQIRAIADTAPEESDFFAPFGNLPASMPEAEREVLREQGLAVIRDTVLPAYGELADWFETEYIPGSRDSLGISEVPDGRALYQTLVRYHTTLDTSPEEVHARGLAEVERIRGEMDAILEEVGFEGSFADFLHFLRTDPQFYAETEEELLMHAAWIAKRADDQMPRFFGRLPRLPYGVRPVPASMAPNYTTGRYWPGDAENGVAGGYMVNTYNLSQRPLYNLPALTVHEAVPGHHHQFALSQEMEDVPEFRRNLYITAFGEGWGLYTENLAIDMGLYTTPYENFGRLTYEMWRACRLVVDTGIHWYGWTREEAEACFLENSALAPHNVRTEVSRYISWPGQALAYKTGELLMRDLRARAEEALGEDFDIRAFHDAMLELGGVPLDFLDAHMTAWIAAQGE
ncbi:MULTISPECIES: DUF885 domain-containing protein [Hyphobacterium]|uniref:DUF885 domain-containing protein n=1 Tax=Hyphobacterium vulgare TaxID=1736751 RepID=A0ABV6ZWR4_9PROT